MARIKNIIAWVLHIAGLMFATSPPTPNADAQKAVTDEDRREIAAAAAPPKPIDDILYAMQRNQD